MSCWNLWMIKVDFEVAGVADIPGDMDVGAGGGNTPGSVAIR